MSEKIRLRVAKGMKLELSVSLSLSLSPSLLHSGASITSPLTRT